MPTNPQITVKWRRDAMPTLRTALRVWAKRQKGWHARTVKSNVEQAFRLSQRLVPVRSGKLKRSGRTEYSPEGLSGSVVYDAEHAAFVEFGTGRRGASSPHPALPEGYRHGRKPGMRAQPYIAPAIKAVERRFIEQTKKNLSRA